MALMVAVTPFGIESIAKRELLDLGFDVNHIKDGRVYFTTDAKGIAHANMHLRTVERIYYVVAQKTLKTFDELFDFVSAQKYRDLVNPDGKFIVNAQSKNSELYSLRDIQKITKKALVETFKDQFNRAIFEERGEVFDFLVYIHNDEAELLIDTSGDALHKRGYRLQAGEAPIKETLAAALIQLSFYDKDRTLIDPFCGAGTIPIEAAMFAKNIAPGLNRTFACERFPFIGKTLMKTVRKEALKAINQDVEPQIYASDIDPAMIEIAKDNAFEAGVDDVIHFQMSHVSHFIWQDNYSVVISNPPYGKRIGENKALDEIYKALGKVINTYQKNSFYIMTPYMGFEKQIGKKANKTRVLFNGTIKTRFYQFFGPKPPQ